jgi:hypothetical protein
VKPTKELADAIYREKVMRSRGMTVERRIEVGAELSDVGREMMGEAIRREFLEASVEDVRREMRRRIALSRKLDNLPLPSGYGLSSRNR